MTDEYPGGFFLKIIFLAFISTLFFFSLFSKAQAESTFAFAKRVNTYFNVRNYEFPPRGPLHYEFFVSAGVLGTQLKNSSTVYTTPTFHNTYNTAARMKYSPLGGLGIGYAFYPKDANGNSRSKIVLGVSSYYMPLGKVNGIELQGGSGSGFGTLNYRFFAQSIALFAQARFIYTRTFWQPFITIAAGDAWNQLYNYSETATAGGTIFTPGKMSDHSTHAFAYGMGLGVQHQFYASTYDDLAYDVAISYNYFDLGKANLGPYVTSFVQTTSDRLRVNDFTANTILFSIVTYFN